MYYNNGVKLLESAHVFPGFYILTQNIISKKGSTSKSAAYIKLF